MLTGGILFLYNIIKLKTKQKTKKKLERRTATKRLAKKETNIFKFVVLPSQLQET